MSPFNDIEMDYFSCFSLCRWSLLLLLLCRCRYQGRPSSVRWYITSLSIDAQSSPSLRPVAVVDEASTTARRAHARAFLRSYVFLPACLLVCLHVVYLCPLECVPI